MPKFRLTRDADLDVAEILWSGAEKFGIAASRSYAAGLFALFERLAQNPAIGRSTVGGDMVTRRHPYRRHVVFYDVTSYGISILRIYPMARLQNPDQPD